MGRSATAALVGALSCAATVLAHGHVSGLIHNGVYYQGYESDSFPYDASPPVVFGWTTNDKDNGFVAPDAFGGPDIICHRNATPAGGHIQVAAGDSLNIQWSTWPDSHVGPITDMLANCNGPCETVDKTTLEWFVITRVAWISGADPGNWAPNVLIANNFSWLVQIPASIAPGNYVLRHEIIALHAAMSADGAQAYPQCINLQITGSGTLQPSGVPAVGMYSATDPGILYDIYQSPLPSYTIPAPPLIAGVSSSVAQSTSKATATATATTTYPAGGNTGGGSPTTTPSATAPASTTPAGTASTSVSPPPSSRTTSAAQTTTTTTTTTTAAATTTKAPTGSSGGGTQTLYGQCGGSGYSGPTACVAGGKCSSLNAYYAQCVAG